MNSGFVMSNDLVPDLSQDDAYTLVAERMIAFIAQIEGDHSTGDSAMNEWKGHAQKFFKPFIDGMNLEGSYNVKIPCYNKNLVNPTSPKECMKGSPWVDQAQQIMGGDISDKGVSMYTSDNFHRVYVVTPHHLP